MTMVSEQSRAEQSRAEQSRAEQNPLLSVIMPVYNGEKYLEEAVRSVLGSSFRDLELIVVDDGSKDRSAELLDAFAASDDRVRVLHQSNQGVSAARNNAMFVARGKYVTFADADDWIEADLYEKTIPYMEEHGLEILIFGLYFSYDGSEKGSPFFKEGKMSRDTAIFEMFQGDHFQGWPWNKIYLRHLVTRHSFDRRLKICEDLFFNYCVFREAEHIGYLPIRGYHYRQNTGSATHGDVKFFSLDFEKCILEQGLPENDRTRRAVEDDIRYLLLGSFITAIKREQLAQHKEKGHYVWERIRRERKQFLSLITCGFNWRMRAYVRLFSYLPFEALPLIGWVGRMGTMVKSRFIHKKNYT